MLSAVITVIKKAISASDTANHANSRLLEAAINAPKKRAFIVPNFKEKKPPELEFWTLQSIKRCLELEF